MKTEVDNKSSRIVSKRMQQEVILLNQQILVKNNSTNNSIKMMKLEKRSKKLFNSSISVSSEKSDAKSSATIIQPTESYNLTYARVRPQQTRNHRTCVNEMILRPKYLALVLILSFLSQSLYTTLIKEIGSQETTSLLLVEASTSQAVQSATKTVLLDTTEQSSLGWTKFPDGGPQTRTPGWVEESFTNFESGINWRSFVVCDVAFNSVNNWLWTPYIERGEANRLHIEIKFTMRDCNLFPQLVLSCKETFALLYKEMDAPTIHHNNNQIGGGSNNNSLTSSTPPETDNYLLVDAIAADEGRFTSNNDVVINTEIRSIPVTKRGVYFAFRDQGACLSLISIKVYHLHCPQQLTNFARFNATPTGRDLISLVAAEGQCVPNSVQVEQPKMFCSADGQWNSMTSGQCRCLAGYEPANNNTKCQACPVDKFKPSLGELACQTCPEHSSTFGSLASSECKCHEGYYRASKDSRSMPCTQPPSGPSNLSAIYVDSSSVVLQWLAPKFTGGREDITYRLLCDQCDQTMISSPQFYANFSETKIVLSGLSPATSYRFLVQAMNGVTSLALQQHTQQQQQQSLNQYSEITVQTLRPVQQTPTNTLSSGQGGFQLTPIYNFRALPGARGSDMLLAWDAQPLDASNLPASIANDQDLVAATQQQQLPSLYEIRYQQRYLIDRRSPYPASINLNNNNDQQHQQQQQQQSITTVNRAVAITGLTPRTDYAFQIRAKWAHTNQWTDYSEPVYMTTSNQMPALQEYINGLQESIPGLDPASRLPFNNQQLANKQSQEISSSSGSWLSTFALILLCALICLAFISVTLIHYRKSICMQSLGAGFGTLSGAGSTYGGVYGSGSAGLMGGVGAHLGGFGNPLGLGIHGGHPHAQHHATMSASSAGGLITGSNGTSRSSSQGGGGTGNVVQNFIAATLSQITSGVNGHSRQANGHNNHTMGHHHHSIVGGNSDKLFAANGQAIQAHQRNHYHQTLGNSAAAHQTLLLGGNNLANNPQSTVLLQHHQQQLNSPLTAHLASAANQQTTANDLFKFRTLNQPGAQYVQQDPQMHIYDDLENTCSNSIQNNRTYLNLEIEPQRVSIESVVGRGEFGEVCLAHLKSSITGAESRVAVKTLKGQAVEKAKLDFLVEALIISQFEHPNIIHLEGVVTKSEPFMIVNEFMENGSLDSYLRENKNRFTYLQLISMLRGVASGMQYLAKLNYVHKDLAARNILVNGQNVCKIADFGLSAHQPTTEYHQSAANTISPPVSNQSNGDYSNDSTSTNSSNTLSSQTTGSTPTTASTMAGSSNLAHLQSVAEQIAQQRFSLQQQQQLNHQTNTLQPPLRSVQNPKIPVRWTALEAIAYRRFTSASDVWSFGIVCWEVMTEGERPYGSWTNQDVIKAVEQGYRLPQPNNCPDHLYKMMLDCWLKESAARPNFTQILKTLDRLLSPYDDPFCQLPQTAVGCPTQQPQLVPMQTRISNQEPTYYDTYISQLNSNKNPLQQHHQQQQQAAAVDEWLNSIRMSRYKENFQLHHINSLQYVAQLNQADLNIIGIQNNQHIKKILNAIAALRSTSSIGPSGQGYLV